MFMCISVFEKKKNGKKIGILEQSDETWELKKNIFFLTTKKTDYANSSWTSRRTKPRKEISETEHQMHVLVSLVINWKNQDY